MTAAVLAVDGGGSKTDVVLIDRHGKVVGAARGAGSNHTHSDHASAMRVIDALVAEAAGRPAGTSTAGVAELAVLCLAGADFPVDERWLLANAASHEWASRLVIRNDAMAMLRAGTDAETGVALVCGAGINCIGVGPGGRMARFAALGDISGDWGGGYDIGMAALAAAIRAEDGRGPRTSLADLVPRHFGVTRPSKLVLAIYTSKIEQHRMAELPRVVFAAATDGDEAALAIVDRQAVELAAMAAAAIRRLRLTRAAVDVVLGGGILTSGHRPLLDRVAAGVLAVAPKATLIEVRNPPVAGAAVMGLAELGLTPAVDVRAAIATALPIKET
jgi:N-acetylglucosamine kinase-like BadF-type ATPase